MSGPQHISRSTEKHHALLLHAPSPRKADGHHCTAEWRELAHASASWERIERSWEIPIPFSTREQAEAVAHSLALRFASARAYRVVDPHGNPLRMFLVERHLLEVTPTSTTRACIEPDSRVPLISDVL